MKTQAELPDLFHVVACCPKCATAFNGPPGNATDRCWVTCPDCKEQFWGLVLPRCEETTFGGKIAHLPVEYDIMIRVRPHDVRFSQKDIDLLISELEKVPNRHYDCQGVTAWLVSANLIHAGPNPGQPTGTLSPHGSTPQGKKE